MDNAVNDLSVPPVPPARSLRDCWILVAGSCVACAPLALFVTHKFILVPIAACLWFSVWFLEKKPRP